MADKPTNYVTWLPRVSSIVEWVYPFGWDERERFLDWLWEKDVELEDYMKEASTWGTYVHASLEKYLKTWEWNGRKYKNLVEFWIQFIKDYDVKPIETEKYVKCRDYQGTCDLIAEIDWEKWILDWKTYWLAKTKFWIATSKYRKPTDKLKKARLQLNLYWKVLKIDKFAVVELTEFGYKFYPLEKMEKKELDWIIKEFKLNYVDEL